jgi:hypothetical protein
VHHLFSKHYESWVRISDQGAKYFIRVWQDGLYSATHPEWTFFPFNQATLSVLFDLFQPGQENDFNRSQRREIQSLSRQNFTNCEKEIFGLPPESNSFDSWKEYFDECTKLSDNYWDYIRDTLVTEIQEYNGPTCHRKLNGLISEFSVEAIRRGFTARELYVRAGTGIIDPNGLKSSQSHMERVLGLINFIHRCDTKEYVTISKITSNKPISNRLMSQITGLLIDSAHECPQGSHLARMNSELVAVSRAYSTHSVSAYEEHRYSCRSILHARQSSLRRTDLSLKNSSRVYLGEDVNGKGWRHDTPKSRLSDRFRKVRERIDSPSFIDALEALNDNPEKSVRLLCDIFEREFGKSWPNVCSEMYVDLVRRELRRQLILAINVAGNRKLETLDSPSWHEKFSNKDEYVDFMELANQIDLDDVHSDILLSERLRIIENRAYVHKTQKYITELIILAKGIRNIVVHSREIPIGIRNSIRYLAKLLLILFDLASLESR